jgi:hypothetical protein
MSFVFSGSPIFNQIHAMDTFREIVKGTFLDPKKPTTVRQYRQELINQIGMHGWQECEYDGASSDEPADYRCARFRLCNLVRNRQAVK